MKQDLRAVIFSCAVFITCALIAMSALAAPDYRGMIERIGLVLDEAIVLYQQGSVPEAKAKAQSAYFEIFENLEGPIRVNVSARKGYELESAFVEIRRMIVDGAPLADIRAKRDGLITELHRLLPKLEGGFQLKAEAASSEHVVTESGAAMTRSPADAVQAVEPYWQDTLAGIESLLTEALRQYDPRNTAEARNLVVRAQFEGYKNSLLETAVRRFGSMQKDVANNKGFSNLAGLMNEGADPVVVKQAVDSLLTSLSSDLPGLPLLDKTQDKNLGKSPDQKALAKTAGSDEGWDAVREKLFAALDAALGLYDQGQGTAAIAQVQDAYFDLFEGSGLEGAIGVRDAELKAKLERYFSLLIGQMKNGLGSPEIRTTLGAMQGDFQQALVLLEKDQDSLVALFFYSLMILLREGIEAILVVTAIIAYLVKTGHQDRLGVIRNALMVALVASALTAVLVKWVFKLSAADQEVLEGGTMLLAAVVLFSVSYWLISKAEAQKWLAYIKDKVGDSLSSGSQKALWFAVFLAVYREGAETVLFYQALASGSDSTMGMMSIGGGFVVGCILLAGIFYAMRYSAIKLPLRPFFLGTGALLYFMAFKFAGDGMMELIAGKVVDPSLVTWAPTLPFIGVYPYWQTLFPQLVMLLAAIAALAMLFKQASAKELSAQAA